MTRIRDLTDTSVWHDDRHDPLSPRWHAPGLLLGALMVLAVVIVSSTEDLPVRDVDKMLSGRMVLLFGTIAFFLVLDILPRAHRRPEPLGSAVVAVARERWTRRRVAVVLLGLLSFYATYLSYRNLKSFIPFLVPQDFDPKLLDLDRDLFLGTNPGPLLHDLLGTGITAHVLSAVYLFYLAFIPISLGAALIAASNPIPGLWYVTALGINWTLGVVSYYLLPSLGPIFVVPELYSALPETGTSALQQALLEERRQAFSAAGGGQSIAAFASLHVSVVFTAALIAELLRLRRVLRVGMWVFFALTVLATLYFGWHYIVDDIAGVVIGAIAVLLSGVATGHLRPSLSPRARARIPNALTLLRVLMVPAVVLLLLEHGGDSMLAAGLFAASSATDAIDGHLARRWKTVSPFGTLIDPAADKLLVLGSLGALAAVDRVALWVVVVVAAREALVSAMRAHERRRGVVVPASALGKVKMGVQVAAILVLMVVDPGHLLAETLVLAMLAITIASGLDHALRARRRRSATVSPPARRTEEAGESPARSRHCDRVSA